MVVWTTGIKGWMNSATGVTSAFFDNSVASFDVFLICLHQWRISISVVYDEKCSSKVLRNYFLTAGVSLLAA